jgi:DNA-binding HxlR family transcriptional regulator
MGDEGSSVQEYELTPFGHELLLVAEALEAWLAIAPDGPIAPEGNAAKVAIKALVGGWTTAIVRALAARPLALTELDRLIDNCTYPALERRLSAMRLAGQIELTARNGSSGRSYRVEPWLRQAIGPLTVAARCERRHMRDETAPIARIDVEAAFLLVGPTIELCADTSGTCQLAVEAGGRHAGRPWAGAQMTIEDGRVVSCLTRLEAQPESWAMGTASAWMDAVIGREAELLEFGGDGELGRDIVHALHDVLFEQVPVATPPD